MPTVPSTCVSVDPLVSVPLSNPDLLASDESIAGPTPDPDTDDLVLVPSDVGNAVSQDSLERTPPQPILKPRLELGTIVLHSPSSIVGTPFDPSPRFEYPFPAPGCPPQMGVGHPHGHGHDLDPVIPSAALLSSPLTIFPSALPPLSVPVTAIPPISLGGAIPITAKAKGDVRSFSPTHPKLNPRDPPVPPGLVKRLHRADAAASASAQDGAAKGRPRGDSVSSLSGILDQLNVDARGRERSPDARRGNERTWSPSPSSSPAPAQNAKWKRNTLAFGDSPRRPRTPDQGSKLFLAQSSSTSSPALAHEMFGYSGLRSASPVSRPSAPVAL